jgi:hypothetical protein
MHEDTSAYLLGANELFAIKQHRNIKIKNNGLATNAAATRVAQRAIIKRHVIPSYASHRRPASSQTFLFTPTFVYLSYPKLNRPLGTSKYRLMSEVKLYVYDLSNGMARQLSQQLTGRQIDGIWYASCLNAEF